MTHSSERSVGSHHEVLDQLGVAGYRTRRVRRGRNTHWIARGDDQRVVLRRYARECSLAEVEYELRVLEHLSQREWPVPAAIAGPLEAHGCIWCLFPYLAGRQPTPRTQLGIVTEQRRRGRLLARLHVDLAPLAELGQRTGWRRTDEGLFDRSGRRPARDVLRDHGRRDPAAARLLLEYDDRARERLDVLAPLAPDPIVIHGDVAPWNMRYAKGKLTGLFDFDVTHLDLRVADFALS